MTARPRTTAELGELLRDAHDRRRPVRVVGRDRWPAAGPAVAPDAEPLDVSGLSGITAYVPGDLTLTARAGTTIGELDAATGAHGQWCPLLPWGGDDGTIGATFATATRGPCSAALGAPRDLAIGLECVDGTGAVIRAGGRLVKNVAGFDLTRLLVGSWGSLGVITEVSVRLRARPEVDESWIVTLREGGGAPFEEYRRGPLAPLAVEPFEGRVLVRLGGNAAFVAASRARLASLGSAEPRDTDSWDLTRARAAGPRAPLTANAIADPLSQRVKRQFDPRHILNPGIMGEDRS